MRRDEVIMRAASLIVGALPMRRAGTSTVSYICNLRAKSKRLQRGRCVLDGRFSVMITNIDVDFDPS
jgi:hypothetical protein